jgi:5'-methylthioadenosine phosphorylase
MTVGPEARLAREAELCYASLTMVTDYDAWKGASATAETEQIIQMLQQTRGKARAVVEWLVPILFREDRDCPCGSALKGSLITPPDAVPERTLRRLELLLPGEKYGPAG